MANAKPRQSRRKPFWALDCETDPFKAGRVPVPFIWGLYDGQSEEYLEFDTPEQVANYLSDKNIIVYAHNGGKFDYHYLKEFINTDENIMVIAGRLAKFKIGDCEFRDSMNLLVNPLRAFAKEEMDYTKLEADVRAEHLEEIKKYLRSDCVNLWNTINAYFNKYGVSLTQAGASMRYWKKHYKVPAKPQTLDQSIRYRDYYYGGRVQCFASGHAKRDFKIVDINSAYPFAMLSKHPISPEAIVVDELGSEEDIRRSMVTVDAIAKGCFPIRDEKTSALYFPDDEKTVREYRVTGWELLAAFETNSVKVINVKKVHRFTQTVDFGDYINHFYAERLKAKRDGNKFDDIFAKLFMNSLYGKFAADPRKYKEYLIANDQSIVHWGGVCGGVGHCSICGGSEPLSKDFAYELDSEWPIDRFLMSRALPESKHKFFNVATAGSITGFVRAHLWKALCKCSGLIYCDTDSIMAEDVSSVPQGSNLGEFKLEMECNEYAIVGKKTYAARGIDGKWKVASKGVSLTPEQILQAAKGERIIYNPEVPTYSIHREAPRFISREVKSTYKDIAHLEAKE